LKPGIRIAAAVIAALAAAGPGLAAERPSFQCAKAATATEKAICANDRLARLDRAIAAAYRRLNAELSPEHEAFGKEQSEFLKNRDACGADTSCLASRMEGRRAALALEPAKDDPRGAFVGRFRDPIGLMIVRRRFDGAFELTGSKADPGARWMCDISGRIQKVERGVATVEAGEEGDSHPVFLTMKGDTLVVAEDPDRRLAGYTCGANGSIEGEYRRVPGPK
jgi:uncharacterized protein YecT (DUF1311 family)